MQDSDKCLNECVDASASQNFLIMQTTNVGCTENCGNCFPFVHDSMQLSIDIKNILIGFSHISTSLHQLKFPMWSIFFEMKVVRGVKTVKLIKLHSGIL